MEAAGPRAECGMDAREAVSTSPGTPSLRAGHLPCLFSFMRSLRMKHREDFPRECWGLKARLLASLIAAL